MCGIAGIYRRITPDPCDPARIAAMTDTLTHRGPDDCGYLELNSSSGDFRIGPRALSSGECDVFFGNRRLSIIDLSSEGRQPMANETDDIFITFNGEIFNYLGLRSELAARGHAFRSHTDTEVVVHAYEEWGQDCVKRFNGMWAFAIWDQRRRHVFCSRDRFGIKPFYYHLGQHAFVFASEIKGLLPALEKRPDANLRVLTDYLIDGSLCRTNDTFFEGIERLEPAHNLIVSQAGSWKTRYWNYGDASGAADAHSPVDTFRELLDDSVKLRLRSDVPVGVALSGGIDSSSILALAARAMTPHSLKAFTAVFPGEAYDESQYAELATRATGVELIRIDYQPGDFIEDLSEVTWSLDYPALEGQVLPRWHVLRAAGEHVKVILEGQGADEMLAGYVARYFAPYLMDRLLNPGDLGLGSLLRSWLEVHRTFGWRAYRGLMRQLVPSAAHLRAVRRLSKANRVYTREFMNAGSSESEHARFAEGFQDRMTKLMCFDHAVGILPMLLKFGDSLSMAQSIESRLPFLDHRLVEFVFGLPAHHKLRGSESKPILREAMRGIVPQRILDRKDKVGFVAPVARWVRNSMDTGIRPLLMSQRCKERGIFDARRVEKILDRQEQLGKGFEKFIFRWVSLELWFRLFVDGGGFAGVQKPVASPYVVTASEAM